MTPQFKWLDAATVVPLEKVNCKLIIFPSSSLSSETNDLSQSRMQVGDGSCSFKSEKASANTPEAKVQVHAKLLSIYRWQTHLISALKLRLPISSLKKL